MKYRPEKTEGGWQQAAVAEAQDEIKAIIAKCVAEGMPFDRFMKMVSDEIDELVDDIGVDSLSGTIRESLTKYATEHYRRLEAVFGGLNAKNVMRIGYLQSMQLSTQAQKKMEAEAVRFGDSQYNAATAGNTYYANIYKQVREEIDRLVREDAKIDDRVSLRASIEMVIRGQMQDKMVADLRASGVTLAWIRPHANCSKRCERWQGKLYSLDGKRGAVDGIRFRPLEDAMNIYVRTSKGRVWRNGCISGFNCRHQLIPYAKGNKPTEIPADVIARKRKLEETQRKMEREVRKQKSIWRAYNKFSDKGSRATAAEARDNYQILTLKYEQFCRKNGLPIYRQRLVPQADQLLRAQSKSK